MTIRMTSGRRALAAAPALLLAALVAVTPPAGAASTGDPGDAGRAGLRASAGPAATRLPGTLLVARDGNLWSIRADGTGWRQLADEVTTAAWSPDGTRVA